MRLYLLMLIKKSPKISIRCYLTLYGGTKTTISKNQNPYDKGGLNFLDFYTLNNTFKINWLKQFIKNPSSIWNFIPNFIFSKFGGLNFLLLCNYNVEKIPSKLSNFGVLVWQSG